LYWGSQAVEQKILTKGGENVKASVSLVDQVQNVNADKIDLPVLRELVRDVQSKTSDQIKKEGQLWSDGDWRQWRQHSSHNPW